MHCCVCYKPVLCQNGCTDRAVFGMLDLSYTVSPKIRVLPAGTLSQLALDLE